MSYNKKNWKTGDYVTQKDINNIENGIYEAHTDISNINNTLGTDTLNTTDKTLKGAINELFQNVSDGKELIASAITDKGVITSNADTFQQMANNIRNITIKEDIIQIFLNDISNMTVYKGQTFNILYSSNISAVKHEISWDGGNTFYDKTSEIVTENTVNYKYNHNAETEYDSFNMAIRVTNANGNTDVKYFTITFENNETEAITYTMALKTSEPSTFNDVNNDGLGEFQGWGTSLCWWANRLGYNKNLINQAVDKFYSEQGLNLNIGRYNIGGGDCVKDTFDTPYSITTSNKTQVYDLVTSGLKPEYFGSSMEVYTTSDLSNSTYTITDNDLNISSGNVVGDISGISYVSKIDDNVDLGGSVTFKNINVTETGKYTLKLLLTLAGDNDRDLAVIINGVSKYTKSKDIINNNIIASGNARKLYLVTINSITLIQGKNTIEIGGNTTLGLDVVKMAIVRSHYDNEYTPWIDTPMNKKADIYDFLDDRYPTYAGDSQDTYDLEMNTTYTVNDANFGIQTGVNVGKLKCLNHIPMLDEYSSSGSNVTYEIYVKEQGSYSIQLMLYLTGTNDRDVAIKVNGTKYSMDASSINNNIIAQNSEGSLYIVRFYDIPLNKGTNTIIIGGNTGWCLDLVKMLIVKTSSYGVLPADNEFLHDAHITRSDSKIPGYCVDVSKIDTNIHSIDWYNEHYTRVDEECGYAWNYDWEADKYQMNVLKAIVKAKGSEFIAEAFSNSPPYFMTNSGCASGATNSSQNNLRDNAYNAFAKYLADVIAHFNLEDDEVTFTSATGMNEPYANCWGANSNKQEGCHMDQGYPQSRVIRALNWNLHDKGVHNCIVSGSDESSIDTAISSYNALDQYAKETISRIDTHTYSGNDRYGLRQLAENEGKNLWMSEVDGDFTAGDNAGHMASALGLAQHILLDLNWLKPSAWILWDIVDMHCDTGNVHDGNDFGWLNQDGGYWGLTACNHDDEYIWCLKKYYAFGQFTRYIRPGHTLIPMSDNNAIASYDPQNHKVVIVVINTWATDRGCKFKLTNMNMDNTNNIQAIRTSGSLTDGENWADVSSSCEININKDNKTFSSMLKANSITTYIINNIYYEGVSPLLDSTGAYVVDDFSGSSVDTNKWKYELGHVRNNELQRYTAHNAEINDGILALRALKDNDGNWTSSSIISHGHFSFMYGKIVARVRACNYNGAFGAFWTLGDTFELGYNEWGSNTTLGEWWAWCGEFDIMEYYKGNLTCGAFFNEKDQSGRVYYNNYPTGDWHEFGMEWLENGTLIFTIDGYELSRTPATDNRAFHIPHYILLNQAVGAAGGTPDDWCSEITQYVDWVKYYPASTDNVVLYTSNFSIAATDRNNNRCVVRATFNDNCINKVLSWSCDRTDLATVHSGLVTSTSWSANGTVNITATSPSGVSQTIQLNIVNGVIQ